MKQKSVVCDIDGTMSDDRQRKINATQKNGIINWNMYFDPKEVSEDKPNEELKEKINNYKLQGLKIIFLTGRPSYLYKVTMDWLNSHNIAVDLLVMRDLNDYTYLNIEDFKTRKLKEIKHLYDIVIGFDDLDEGIKACKNNDIYCEKIKITGGDYK